MDHVITTAETVEVTRPDRFLRTTPYQGNLAEHHANLSATVGSVAEEA